MAQRSAQADQGEKDDHDSRSAVIREPDTQDTRQLEPPSGRAGPLM